MDALLEQLIASKLAQADVAELPKPDHRRGERLADLERAWQLRAWAEFVTQKSGPEIVA